MANHYGFPNIETWQASLHISNDERTYRHYYQMAEVVYEAGPTEKDATTGRESAIRELAEIMREDHEDVLSSEFSGKIYSEYRATLAGDIVGLWIRRVDWHRIASDMIEGVAG